MSRRSSPAKLLRHSSSTLPDLRLSNSSFAHQDVRDKILRYTMNVPSGARSMGHASSQQIQSNLDALPPARRTSSPGLWEPSHGIVFSKLSTGVENRSVSEDTPPHRVQLPFASTRQSRTISSNSTSARRFADQGSPGDFPNVRSPPQIQARWQSTKADPVDGTRNRDHASPPVIDDRAVDLQNKANNLVESLRGTLASLILGDQSSFSRDAEAASSEAAQEGDTQKDPQFWTYKHYGEQNGTTPEVKVCDTLESANEAVAPLLDERILGFDIEWVANANADKDPKRRVSLVQVAGEKLIVLIQIAKFPGTGIEKLMPPNLKALIEDPDIKKFGVNIRNDCTRIRGSFNIDTAGIYELSHLYKLIKYSPEGETGKKKINKRLVALSTQVEEHLGLPLYKDSEVRSSDWTQPLTDEQKLYAGSDAYAGYALFHEMNQKRLTLNPVPDLPGALEFNKDDTEDTPKRRRANAHSAEDQDVGDDEKPENGDSADPAGAENLVDESVLSSAGMLAAATAFAHAQRAAMLSSRGAAAARPGVAQLRAYHLWQAESLDIPAVSKLLGVKYNTVAGYVLESMMVGRLPGSRERVEVLIKYIPMGLQITRYAGLLKRVAGE